MKSRLFLYAIFYIIVSAILFVPSAQAQFAIGPHLSISVPQDEFANVTKSGEGIGIKFIYELPSLPFFAFRGDLTYISYGAKPGGYYYTSTSERNESFRLLLGSQLTFTINRYKLYGDLLGGVYNFRLVYSEVPLWGGYPLTATLGSRTKLGWSIGGGIMIDIGLGPWIDLGVRYHTINNIIAVEVDGETVESDGNDFGVTIGVVFFLNR